MTSNRPIDRAIRCVGNQRALAELLRVDKSNVSRWASTGHVPHKHRLAIAKLTRGTPYAVDVWDFDD